MEFLKEYLEQENAVLLKEYFLLKQLENATKETSEKVVDNIKTTYEEIIKRVNDNNSFYMKER